MVLLLLSYWYDTTSFWIVGFSQIFGTSFWIHVSIDTNFISTFHLSLSCDKVAQDREQISTETMDLPVEAHVTV